MRLTYGQLQEEIAIRIATLRASYIGVGDRVGIYVPSENNHLYVSIFISTVVAAYVLVDVDDSDERANVVWPRLRALRFD